MSRTIELLSTLQLSVLKAAGTRRILSHLEHIGNDKEVGKDPPLLPHCKQSNDPGEAQQGGKDDGGFQQSPACESNVAITIESVALSLFLS